MTEQENIDVENRNVILMGLAFMSPVVFATILTFYVWYHTGSESMAWGTVGMIVCSVLAFLLGSSGMFTWRSR